MSVQQCYGAITAHRAPALTRELKVWAKVKHSNVLELVGYYLSAHYDCAQLVSPYMENGNITEYIKRTQADIETRLGFVRGITSGMEYLHSRDPPICHGDLKPANVLISDKPDAVLCDFGLATFNSGDPSGLTTSRTIKGATRYMSPELFDDDESKHTLESDIWAWGCTIFEVITDSVPYPHSRTDRSILLALVKHTSPGSMESLESLASTVDWSSHSTIVALQTIIPECWSRDPKTRPPCSSILKRLTDAGFANADLPNTQPPPGDTDEDDIHTPTPKISILSKKQLRERGYHRMVLETRNVNGWVSNKAPKPEVLHLVEGGDKMSISPDGRWLVTELGEVGKLWDLEDLSAPPLILPGRWGSFNYEWSPDSRYLACLRGELYIWSIESQSSVGYFGERLVRSLAWFSNGEALACLDVNSGGCVSIMIGTVSDGVELDAGCLLRVYV
ncbi:hypothetical protein FRC00_003063 [Tulasnella sp. 408]|nr:hypothetical protein FRC00_003063 [Tulasnella sp. 408]